MKKLILAVALTFALTAGTMTVVTGHAGTMTVVTGHPQPAMACLGNGC
jgi:hypothetical protein